MRNNIVHPGADELTYEIREIVAVAERLKKVGVPICWENIGDPVAKGHVIPDWIKTIVSDLTLHDNNSYGYSPTRGIRSTREFIAAQRNAEGGAQITPDDILFFNGLRDAIQTSFLYLHPRARILGPDPAYPTYSSAEGAHAGAPHLTYNLVPEHNWQPDIEDIRNKVRYNPEICGILIINPDNPTGTVYREETLRGIVAIAREYDLFVMSDEIYANIVYDGTMTPLSKVLDGVPGIAMKGLSKEVPWPGARCGWMEVYNSDRDPIFARYVKTLVDAKMLEVCSTTLPQKALPKILSDARYETHLAEVSAEFAAKAQLFYDALHGMPGLIVNKPMGAFYATVVFEDGVLTDQQTLPIENQDARGIIGELLHDLPLDKRFVYYLMASTGVVLVPLSGMNSHRLGFRMTLLEKDVQQFSATLATLRSAIERYCASTRTS